MISLMLNSSSVTIARGGVRSVFFGALAFAGVASFVTGCARDEGGSTVVVLQALAPDDSCTIMASDTAAGISAGILDVANAKGYFLSPLIKNFAVADTPALTTGRTFFGAGFRVTLNADNAGVASAIGSAKTTTVLSSFSTVPNGSLTAMTVNLFQPETVTAIAGALGDGQRAVIDVAITAFGTMGGTEQESQPFHYPVTVCKGCLFANVGPCAGLPDDFEATLPCRPGQDDAVQCCTSDAGVTCPAAKPPM